MLCVKVRAKDFNTVKSLVEFAEGYRARREGDWVLIPIKSPPKDRLETVECDPKPFQKHPRVRELVPGVSGYQLVGDIAMVSPKKEVDLHALGEAVLKSNSRVKGVFLREKVEGELRVNRLTHIGGENRTSTVYKEGGLKFVVDLAKVYVNTTLSHERDILAQEIRDAPVLDAFAGYGPLALRLGKKGLYTVAGDINLEGIRMAVESAKLNRIYDVDFVVYDAHFLPFRDKAFKVAIADNPTMYRDFLEEVCRVSRRAIVYALDNEEVLKGIFGDTGVSVNEFSKDLNVFRFLISCD